MMEQHDRNGIDDILGLQGVSIDRVQRSQDVHVWVRPAQRPNCVYCGGDRLQIKATYQRDVKHTRQGNQIMVLHLSVPKYWCKDCDRYFRHPYAGIRPRYSATEAYKLEVFEAHEGGVSQNKLTMTHGIGNATVERWYQGFIKKRVAELSGRSCPQILGIDEHFFTRKRGYATTLVDLKNHKVFDVVLGRSEKSLHQYLQRLPGREKVRIIVMDMSDTYRRIARRYFPNARIVSDRFHVVRLVNQHFLALWKVHDEEGRKNRGLLSLMRRHHWNLSEVQKERLAAYLATNPVLEAMYHAKQEIMEMLLLKTLTAAKAREKLPRFLELIDQFAKSPFASLAATLTSWLEPIVRMWRFSRSNGITEGFHTKMEMISRRAYGFRNFENYRLRVLALCGWNGVYNRT